ncbi:MAG: hypothetical protein IKD69_04045 [Solobacterium sp.]|nr:hypothetical protein [Solobacterium sp.]
MTEIGRQKGAAIKQAAKGIYRISFYQSCPVQIVVTNELEDKELYFFKALSTNVSREDADRIMAKLKLYEKSQQKEGRNVFFRIHDAEPGTYL